MTIKRSEASLTSTATSIHGMSQAVSHLGPTLDAAVGPALRPDIPEFGDINSQYWLLKARMTGGAADLEYYAKDLQTYVGNSVIAEQVNIKMMLQTLMF